MNGGDGGYRAAAAGEGRGVGRGLGRRGVVWGLGFDLMFWRGRGGVGIYIGEGRGDLG